VVGRHFLGVIPYRHHGIELPDGTVCENSPPGVRIARYADFARGRPTQVTNPDATEANRASSRAYPAGLAGNSCMPSGPPIGSSAAATCAWRGCPPRRPRSWAAEANQPTELAAASVGLPQTTIHAASDSRPMSSTASWLASNCSVASGLGDTTMRSLEILRSLKVNE
jgi:hypothetical protein